MNDLEGRAFVITGANTGIGLETARGLVARGATVTLACRSRKRTEPVVTELRDTAPAGTIPRDRRIDFVELDLGSFASVRTAANALLARDRPLHVLINNAGLAMRRGTTEGFETTFAVNHLGHFLFTCLLVERLRASAPARVVTVASHAHYRAKEIDFDALRKPTATVSGMPEYSVSKLANVLFSIELGRRLEGTGVHTYAVHPGVVASDIWRRIPWPFRPIAKRFMISSQEGAQTSLYCATSEQCADETGLYYDQCTVRDPSRAARDPELAKKLWERSVEWTGAPTSF